MRLQDFEPSNGGPELCSGRGYIGDQPARHEVVESEDVLKQHLVTFESVVILVKAQTNLALGMAVPRCIPATKDLGRTKVSPKARVHSPQRARF